MALSLISPSRSQYLSLHSSFSLEDWNLRAGHSMYHTRLKLLLLGISFTNSPVNRPHRSILVRSSGKALVNQCWDANFASASRSPCSRSDSEKQSHSANLTKCKVCGEISGSHSTSAMTGVEYRIGSVVTNACELNGTTAVKKVAIVWFKHDLRMDDHVGLTCALRYDRVLPLFIFDSSFYAGTLPDNSMRCNGLRESNRKRDYREATNYNLRRGSEYVICGSCVIRTVSVNGDVMPAESIGDHLQLYINLLYLSTSGDDDDVSLSKSVLRKFGNVAGWSKERLSSLFDAVVDLRRSLKCIGSTLVVRQGRSKDVLLALAQEIGATEIIAEEETEQIWYDLVGSVSASLSVKSLSGQKTGVKHWRASLYDLEGLKDVPDNYKEFIRLRRRILPPVDAPTSLPALPANAEPGKLPSLDELIAICDAKFRDMPFGEVLMVAQGQPAESLLMGKPHATNGNSQQVMKATNGVARKWTNLLNKRPDDMPFNFVWERRRDRVVKLWKRDEFAVGGGTAALNMLHVYMKALESTHNPHEGMYEHIKELEKRPGSSFRAIFNRALEFGTLSRRRVYCEGITYERSRGGGSVSPFRLSTLRTAAAVEDVKSIEWYDMIQRKSRDEGSENGLNVCSWRWRGYLIQYSTLGDEGPAVVLIHGFGAFWEHYRDNIRGLAEKGNRVWGLTMVGFGRSEKPLIPYTELVLAELVRDFIIEVVKEPVTLAGNSIGGYVTCVVAGLWSSIVRSLVLLNSAGQVIPNYTSLQYRKPRQTSFIAKRGAQILLVYLRHLSKQLLKRCYPNRTARVDAWLQAEVMRPSFDPGSTAVLESMFHLNPPLPMNFYIDRYNGEVLVIQGVRDPLHNATKRATVLQAFCANVTIRLLNAGHCPHDEVPDEVNALIHDWLRCSNADLAMDTAKLELQFLSSEDAAGIVNGSRIIKSDWFSYFSR